VETLGAYSLDTRSASWRVTRLRQLLRDAVKLMHEQQVAASLLSMPC
jgi:hypothetical protein